MINYLLCFVNKENNAQLIKSFGLKRYLNLYYTNFFINYTFNSFCKRSRIKAFFKKIKIKENILSKKYFRKLNKSLRKFKRLLKNRSLCRRQLDVQINELFEFYISKTYFIRCYIILMYFVLFLSGSLYSTLKKNMLYPHILNYMLRFEEFFNNCVFRFYQFKHFNVYRHTIKLKTLYFYRKYLYRKFIYLILKEEKFNFLILETSRKRSFKKIPFNFDYRF